MLIPVIEVRSLMGLVETLTPISRKGRKEENAKPAKYSTHAYSSG
jgi:hypothetical protein